MAMLKWIANRLGSIKLTTGIATLVLMSIVITVLAYSASNYLALRRQSVQQGESQQQSAMKVAASVLEQRLPGTAVTWTDEGELAAIQGYALPFFHDTKAVDAVTRITGGQVAIFAFDATSKQFTAKSTSFATPEGERVINFDLDPASPAYAALSAGQSYYGEIDLQGTHFHAAFQPFNSLSGDLIGGFFVGSDAALDQVQANNAIPGMATIGLTLLVVLGGICLLLSRGLTAPIPRIAGAMKSIAEGELETEVPYRNRRNEIGAMARAVEVFRENALKVGQMTEAEREASIRRREERGDMMVALQAAFGEVVDAAIAGDFTKRVHAEFPDAELNALAGSVNSLVETVDGGLSETGEVLAALADTDLTKRMHGSYSGSFAKLQADTNAVGDKLTEVVTQLRETSRALKTATGEILAGANDLSERTTRQAATIEETSATMEQLAATVAENAKMAEDANTKVNAVSESATRSGAVMTQANAAMERITSSSSKISNIIGMIDDIAFQTNLLALNASVEAARAGDAGKGFAVVAVEVRRLAQSAASASSDVKALIEQSAAEVAGGSKLVSSAAEQLGAMQHAVEENSALMQRIAKASREQAAAIDEVSVAVRTMDEMTQHNAALVEETNAAIEQTEAQANELDRVVDIFVINQADAPVRRAAPAPVRAAATGARGLQDRLRATAKVYATQGNAAIDKDWSEF